MLHFNYIIAWAHGNLLQLASETQILAQDRHHNERRAMQQPPDPTRKLAKVYLAKVMQKAQEVRAQTEQKDG